MLWTELRKCRETSPPSSLQMTWSTTQDTTHFTCSGASCCFCVENVQAIRCPSILHDTISSDRHGPRCFHCGVAIHRFSESDQTPHICCAARFEGVIRGLPGWSFNGLACLRFQSFRQFMSQGSHFFSQFSMLANPSYARLFCLS